MIGRKERLQRARHRRVLPKKIRRVASLNVHESSSQNSTTMHRFLIASIVLAFIYYESMKFSLLFSIIGFFLKRVRILDHMQNALKNYRNLPPRHGPTMREKIYYYVDYWLSTNTYAKAFVLMGLTWCLILTSGTLISWMAAEPWIESLWAAALGSGLDWGFINSTNPSLRLIALCTNVGGLVLTALLLSIISDELQTKYDSLRKGESSVTETGHTLIIGWSVKSLSVMIQLAKAGESTGNNVIVCLSDMREKEDMESDIAQCDFNFASLGTRVVCRSGCPLSHHDLRRVSFFRARCIIVLGDDEHDAETNDARSLQILLSIISALEREKNLVKKNRKDGRIKNTVFVPRPDRIVIEVMDTEHAEIMKSVCPELVETVLAHDVVGRLMLQAARNPLVADVWQELLGFDGCEPYSGQWGILRGLSFREVLLCFEDGIPLGVKTASGDMLLNPPDSYVIGERDEVIVLAEDDDTYCASITHTLIRESIDDAFGTRYIDVCPGGLEAIRTFSKKWARYSSLPLSHLSSSELQDAEPERILYCGWRFDMGNMLQFFSAVAPLGSEFWILSEVPEERRESELELSGWKCNHRVRVIHRVGGWRRIVLAQLPLESFTSVIVGASSSGYEQYRLSARPKGNLESSMGGKSEGIGDADARVINIAMMIQDITKRRKFENCMNNGMDEDNDNSRGQTLRTSLGVERESFKYSEPSNARNVSFNASAITSGKIDPFESPPNFATSKARRIFSLSRAGSKQLLGSKQTADLSLSKFQGVIVGEIVDSRSRAMLSVANSVDAVVSSSELISKAVAMVSADGLVNNVLNTLFDPYDVEISLECAEVYVNIENNERVSFFELMSRGREHGTIILGHLERELVPPNGEEPSTIYYTGVVLNPPQKDLRRSWHPDDLLIVLTPGTLGGAHLDHSDFNTDITGVKQVNMCRELSWSEANTATASLFTNSNARFVQ